MTVFQIPSVSDLVFHCVDQRRSLVSKLLRSGGGTREGEGKNRNIRFLESLFLSSLFLHIRFQLNDPCESSDGSYDD